MEAAEAIVSSGQGVRGSLRVAATNYRTAFVRGGVNNRDVVIPSYEMRNRALDSDVVVVQFLPRSQWVVQEKEAAAKGINIHGEAVSCGASLVKVTEALGQLSLVPASVVARGSRVVVFFDSAAQADEAHARMVGAGIKAERTRAVLSGASLPDSVLQTVGKVVAIAAPVHPRRALGHLQLSDAGKGRFALFVPNDSRFPRLLIPMKACPKPFIDNPAAYSSDVMVICELTSWPLSSFFAHGIFVEAVGSCKNITDCTKALLAENGIDVTPFSAEVEACLPPVPWAIPESEVAVRRDFRPARVFSIDPPTARDVDDALSCTRLEDGSYEVGVHIADVSFFVPPGSPLDKLASERATTTYFIQECFPMLPRLLCDDLCSLLSNVDRLAFSVVWRVGADNIPQISWMGRSIIRSCAKLTYAHAHAVITGQAEQDAPPFPPIEAHDVADIKRDILKLHEMASAMRARRFDGGSLRLDNPKLSFDIDPESGQPTSVFRYVTNEAHQLVEEFMLLANGAVAARLYAAFPGDAMLRHHPQPLENALATAAAACRTHGVEVDYASSHGLHRSLEAVGARSDVLQAAVGHMITKAMQLAQYANSGDMEDAQALQHYALHVPLYTHFTSPIRRYADLIVHRQLAAALAGAGVPVGGEQLSRMAAVCNRRKQAARAAQDGQVKLFLCEYIRARQPLRVPGIVVGIRSLAFDVLLPHFGEVVRVDLDGLPLANIAHSEQDQSLVLYFSNDDPEAEPRTMMIDLFQELEVRVDVTGRGLRSRLSATIAGPEVLPPL